MKIVLVGDVYPGGDLEETDASRAVAVPAYCKADYRIATLEAAMSDADFRANKCVLTCSSSAAQSLRHLSINAVSLAENHIHDMGDRGLADTLEGLDALGIGHAGAGRSLAEARRPVWITDKLCILAYCRERALTLNNVAVAGPGKSGVVPLTLENVLEDLAGIPSGAKAILVFHWGCEHLWLTPYDNIELARKLLQEEKVALIAGSHPHRVQGYLEQCGKRAYFSLGNFLFPNFYLDRPCVQVPPPRCRDKIPTTRYYHRVGQLTYKKWLRVNRVSLMVQLEIGSGRITHQFVMQKDASPKVVPAPRWVRVAYGLRLKVLALLSAQCPRWAYERLFTLNHGVAYWSWRWRIRMTRVRHLGVRGIGRRICGRMGAMGRRDGH